MLILIYFLLVKFLQPANLCRQLNVYKPKVKTVQKGQIVKFVLITVTILFFLFPLV